LPVRNNQEDAIMRSMIAVAVFMAITGFGMTSSYAFSDRQWCAVINLGSDVSWNCQYNTLEECRVNVIAGDRSFCNLNPYWRASVAPPAATPRRSSSFQH
jgi:hypothetical protein